MPWLKGGDNAATYPAAMAVAGHASAEATSVEADFAVNEVYGWLVRCAMQSAGHMTDYVIDEGTARMLGGARTDRLLHLAKKARLVSAGRHEGQRVYRLREDAEFLHIRRRDEVQWERARGRDTSNPGLIVPVRLRDGDACRYCGRVVNWDDRKGGLGGTYDHVHPGESARTPEGLRVSCRRCNSLRGDDPDAEQRHPARPVPARAFYGPRTAGLLAKHGHDVETTTLRPGAQPGPAAPPSDPAPGRAPLAPLSDPAPSQAPLAPPATQAPPTTSDLDTAAHQRPGSRPDPAHDGPGSADPRGRTSRSPGTGRERADPGAAREAPPAPAAPPAPTTDPAARRPRGRRGRPPTGDQP